MSMRKSFERQYEQPSNEEVAKAKMDRLESTAQHLLELIRPGIEAHKYDSILSDDADARVHSLVLAGAMQEVYGDEKKLETVFVKGGSLTRTDEPFKYTEFDLLPRKEQKAIGQKLDELYEKDSDYYEHDDPEFKDLLKEKIRNTSHTQEVEAYLKRMKPKLGKWVLFVTEEIDSGGTLETIANLLKHEGIQVDIVTFGTTTIEQECTEEELATSIQHTKDGTEILVGRWGSNPASFDREELGILNEARSGSGHAKAVDMTPEIAKKIRVTRQAAQELSHRLAQNFLAKKA